jgi:uncharacterized protein (DUF2141 family)
MRIVLGLATLVWGLLQPSSVRITVRLTELQPRRGGVLHVALHREPASGFPGQSTYQNKDVAVTGTDASVTFDAPPGSYAVAVHHDANANGKMETNFVGKPKEGYAVSNDIRPTFRAPRFSEARVAVTRDTTLSVRLAY